MARHALLIANSRYADLRDLPGAVEDIAALAPVLQDKRLGDFAVEVRRDEEWHAIHTRLADFLADRVVDDLVWIHYSGHGLLDENGELYFAGSTTRPDRPNGTALSARAVQMLLGTCRARQKVLILDCCYAGAYARTMSTRTARLPSEPLRVAERFSGSPGRGTIVISSSSAIQVAYDGPPTDEAISFTRLMVESIQSGCADRNGDGWIDLLELYKTVEERMRKERPEQRPEMTASRISGDVLVAKTVKQRVASRLAESPLTTPTPRRFLAGLWLEIALAFAVIVVGLGVGALLSALQHGQGLVGPTSPRAVCAAPRVSELLSRFDTIELAISAGASLPPSRKALYRKMADAVVACARPGAQITIRPIALNGLSGIPIFTEAAPIREGKNTENYLTDRLAFVERAAGAFNTLRLVAAHDTGTDPLGALVDASRDIPPRSKAVVILICHGWEQTRELNVFAYRTDPVSYAPKALRLLSKNRPALNLRGVHVIIAGIMAGDSQLGITNAELDSLCRFWSTIVTASHGALTCVPSLPGVTR